MIYTDTIVAQASASGGAIAVIRVGGVDAIAIVDKVFESIRGVSLCSQKGYTIHYGRIIDRNEDRIIDDVLLSLFRTPHSYNGEDMVEISCHGSAYICSELCRLLVREGARLAEAGEFTIRAFLNGKMDLSQAEAVADIIASEERATHTLAAMQMRGGYSCDIELLREQLLELTCLLELELDFGEEDVEFADRTKLNTILELASTKIDRLVSSFSLGNVIKDGIPVVIAGNPNVGKSTLLNALLNDDRVMVSSIAGTTRDVIEESLIIDGIRFRFLDTAGVRDTDDILEQMGIERTYKSIRNARVVVWLTDIDSFLNAVKGGVDENSDFKSVEQTVVSHKSLDLRADQQLYIVVNKIDSVDSDTLNKLKSAYLSDDSVIFISAKHNINLNELTDALSGSISTNGLYHGDTIVYNTRHYEALLHAQESLDRVSRSFASGISADLLSQDIREVLYQLGTITGKITTDEILTSIFSKFCIGK